ncbi:nucleoside hydrolase [Novosphingobium resinovorum]|uniref:nucleoside hydrolase n=1 Tax=Novosphingobium resinovorum TaxID=158500 RepID=UPI002ED27232|nr:nucleoside hydrolase [Novosphingobium resinovorum]
MPSKRPCRLVSILSLLLAALLSSAPALAAPAPAPVAKRLVIVDQDAFEGPGLQPILMLLQDPTVEVLGITTVTGDGWAPEETAATLRMLERVGRTDVPVVQGAVFPLVNSKPATTRREALYGALPYKGAWMDAWPAYNTMKRREPHGPFAVPPLPEGMPRAKARAGSAAEFMLEMTRRFPGQVSIVAMGPLTNLALAQRLDDGFAGRVKELVTEGGNFIASDIDGEHDEFAMQTAFSPRMSFNHFFDPEAAHIVFTTKWRRLVLVTGDANEGIFGTAPLIEKAAASGRPAARYLKQTAQAGFPLWDEVQAAAWLDPAIVTRKGRLAMDVDLMPGANYGALLAWPAGKGPGLGEQDVDVVYRVDKARVEGMFVDFLGR